MKYRPELDGLRALSIIPVILYHLDHNIAPRGFLGVDVFFVISGFLISKILHNKLKSNSFSVLEFYERRIKRIAPLYFIIIISIIPISFIYLTPSHIKDVSQSISASLVFLSNFLFLREINYFNPFAEVSPLIHTWSLSIEEQFYLFLPAFLIIFKGFTRKILIYIFLSISLFYYLYLINIDPNTAFYSTFSRAWELLIGVLFGIKSKNTFRYFNCFSSNYFSIISLISLILILFTNIIDIDISILRIYVVFVSIILINQTNKNIIKILSFNPFVHIGLLS